MKILSRVPANAVAELPILLKLFDDTLQIGRQTTDCRPPSGSRQRLGAKFTVGVHGLSFAALIVPPHIRRTYRGITLKQANMDQPLSS